MAVEHALLDAAGLHIPTRQLHQAFTTAWRMKLTTPKKTLLHIKEFGGRGVRGTRRLREIVKLYEESDRGPGSIAEADFLWDFYAALDEHGIERPELQFTIDTVGVIDKATPDFVWPKRRKVIEMLGLLAHGNYLVQDEDVERAAAIRAAGWDLAELTPRAIKERPKQTIERLIRFLETPAR